MTREGWEEGVYPSTDYPTHFWLALRMCSAHHARMSRLRDYSFTIPEGRETSDGYVELSHCAHYTLNLSNDSAQKCDVEVSIDGGRVGIWRIDARSSIRIERPVHDTGKFTFYRAGTVEGNKAGIVVSDNTGLLRAIFKPERPQTQPLNSRPVTRAGGTGLAGRSDQTFRTVAGLEHDEANFVTINLRLVSPAEEPRPLFPRSTPVPPPVERPGLSRN